MQRLLAKTVNSVVSSKAGDDLEATGSNEQQVSHVARHGGPVIFAHKVVRLLSTLTLLALSIAGVVLNDRGDNIEFSFDSRWVASGLIGTYVRLLLVRAHTRPVDASTLVRLTRLC